MSETKEKSNKSFQKVFAKRYIELKNDGKVYYPFTELEDINLILKSNFKNGVIISGSSGTGKTALVQTFVQQNLNEVFGMESIKVIKIKPIWLIQKIDADKILKTISLIIHDYESQPLIINAEFEELDTMAKALDLINYYIDDIKSHYNLKFIKFIFEFSIKSRKEVPQIKNVMNNSWSLIDYVQEKNIDLLVDKIMPRVEEISKTFDIGYTREVVMFYVAVGTGWFDYNNVCKYINLIERAFMLSKMNGKKNLEKEIIKLIFPKSFEYLEDNPKEAIKNTARHEAGHVLIKLINNRGSSISYVSIIPGNSFNGITSSDKLKRIPSYYLNKDYFLYEIAVDLAGRIAESVLDGNVKPNAGASSDLKNAMDYINEIINKYGISEVLGENYVFIEDDIISEKMTVKIEEEKRKLLKEAESLAKKLILENCDFVEKLADQLCKDYVLLNYQIYDMWKAYLAEKE